jgi:hypothetical protein
MPLSLSAEDFVLVILDVAERYQVCDDFGGINV